MIDRYPLLLASSLLLLLAAPVHAFRFAVVATRRKGPLQLQAKDNNNDPWRSNPAPWPSVENLSRVLAEQARATSTKLPEWQRLPPELAINKEDLCWNAYEKLDGTNVGFACNGEIYGRRYTIPRTETTYQRASLQDLPLPSVHQIRQAKKELRRTLWPEETEQKEQDDAGLQLIVYGELLVPPLRHRYEKSGYEEPWYAFGAVLTTTRQQMDHWAVQERLERAGFCIHGGGGDHSRITLLLNDRLQELLHGAGLATVPKTASGSLQEIVTAQAPVLIAEHGGKKPLEGLVLTTADLPCTAAPTPWSQRHPNIVEWKVGGEDVSKGPAMVRKLLKDQDRLALEDQSWIRLAEQLDVVAGQESGKKKKKKKSTKDKNPVDALEVQAAFDSACTKYDSLSAYFARDERQHILEELEREVLADLQPDTSDAIKFVEKGVRALVGRAYGQWMRGEQQ